MTADNSKLLIRADLVHQPIWMGTQRIWVVKDPLAREFLYFNPQEHEILALADGNRSLAEIIEACGIRFAPQYISAESVVRFFAQAQSKGLLVSDDSGHQQPVADERVRRHWFANPLAIRLPGIQPDRMLDFVYPLFRPLMSLPAVLCGLALIIAAVVVAMTQFASLVEQIAIATSRLDVHTLTLVVIVITLTKIIHELAHALVCKHWGGHCRELGVMLLVGIPTLYCDVSDAWMIAQRWKRILVSAAGMLAELVLAAVATFVWLMANDGTLRDVCVIVMMVCSISTVLFNGNPLLRYDGYYILSDLLGIPNLGAQASAVLRTGLRRSLWGIPSYPDTSTNESLRCRVVLATYAIASGLYRTIVYGLILLMLYRVAEDHALGAVVAVVMLFAIAALGFRSLGWIVTAPDRAVRRASLTPRRPHFVAAGLVLVAVVGCLVPLPHRVVAPMSVQPAGGKTVFVPLAGTLANAISNGEDVDAGQVIATLINFEMEQELLTLRSQCNRLQSQLSMLQRQRGSDPQLAARIPTLEKSLHQANQRRELRERDAQRLTLRAPSDGRLYAPPTVPAVFDDRRKQAHWTGTPLEGRNRGAWLEAGTVIGLVGDEHEREAIVLLRQQQIELVQAGQPVTLLLAGWPRGELRGTVWEVAASPVDVIPQELVRGGWIVDPTAGPHAVPYYRVRVKLADERVPLPARLTGRARITVSPTSLLTRLTRYLRDSFG